MKWKYALPIAIGILILIVNPCALYSPTPIQLPNVPMFHQPKMTAAWDSPAPSTIQRFKSITDVNRYVNAFDYINETHRTHWDTPEEFFNNVGGTCAIESRPTATRETAIARWNTRA